MSDPPYTRQSAFYGSVTLGVLYRAMREVGAPPDEACFVLLKMTSNGDIATRPALDRPYMIDPSPDGRTIVIQTAKKTYAGHEVWVLPPTAPMATPRARQKPGPKDESWEAAKGHLWNYRLRARAEGQPEPNLKKAKQVVGDFLQRTNKKQVPVPRSIERHASEWLREPLPNPTPFEQLSPLLQIERLIQKLPAQARPRVRAMLDATEPPSLQDAFIERVFRSLTAEQRPVARKMLQLIPKLTAEQLRRVAAMLSSA
jgi:hypothetical protein